MPIEPPKTSKPAVAPTPAPAPPPPASAANTVAPAAPADGFEAGAGTSATAPTGDAATTSAPLFRVSGGRLVPVEPEAEAEDEAAPGVDAPDPDPATEAALEEPEVQQGLEAIGVTPDEVRTAGEGAAHLIEAARAAVSGDYPTAVDQLAQAAQAAPELVARAAAKLAEKLPDTGALGALKSLLKDGDFVSAVASDPTVLASAKKLAGGDLTGLTELLQNPAVANAVFSTLSSNPEIKGVMDALGIKDAATLAKVAAAIPDLVTAFQELQAGHLEEAAAALVAAAKKAPELAVAAAGAFASKLSDTGAEGALKQLLSNADVVTALATDETVQAGIAKLAGGDLSGIGDVLSNDAIADAAFTALSGNPELKGLMDSLGITDAATLRDSAAALPDLATAYQELAAGHPEEAATALLAALKKAPNLAVAAANSFASKLSDTGAEGALKQLLQNADFVTALVTDEKLQGGIAKLAGGDLTGLGDVLSNPTVADAAYTALSGNAELKSVMDAIGITDAASLAEAANALPDVIDALKAADEGRYGDAVNSLLAAAGKAPDIVAALASKLAEKLPDTGAQGALKQLLQNGELVKTLVTDETVQAGLAKLANGDLSGLGEVLSNDTVAQAAFDTLSKNAELKSLMDTLGITDVATLKEAAAALPDLQQALQHLQSGEYSAALDSLWAAAQKAPDIAASLIGKLAAKLPDEGPLSVVKQLLSNQELVQGALTDPNVQSALATAAKALAGDPPDFAAAAAAVTGNETLRSAVGAAIMASPYGEQLKALGIEDATDAANLLGALPDVLEAAKALGEGRPGDAIDALGRALAAVPQETLNKVVDKLNLPDWAKEVIKVGSAVLRDPAGLQAMKDALAAVQSGDANALVDALGRLGGVVMRSDDATKVAVLDALRFLPGGLGKLFADHDLNAALVRTGTLESLFTAATALGHGDLEGAVKALGDAALKLLDDGDPLVDGVPISMQGIQNFAKLFERFFDALPNGVKNAIEKQVGDAIGGLLKFIPFVGDAIATGMDVKDLIEELQDGDKLGAALEGASVALDLANFTQAAKAFTLPLQYAVATLSALEDIDDEVRAMKEQFGSIFTGMENDPVEYKPQAVEDAGEYWDDIAAYGLSPEEYAKMVASDPELQEYPWEAYGVILAAKAAGVPVEQFGAFVDQVRASGAPLAAVGDQMFQINKMPTDRTRAEQLVALLGLPGMANWLQQATGEDPFVTTVRALFQDELGREPTQQELEEGVKHLQDADDDYLWEGLDEIINYIEGDLNDEWADYQSRKDREAMEAAAAAEN